MGITLSKTGVKVFSSFQENLIIDQNNSVFTTMRSKKKNAMCSWNSEDAITWNVFKTIEQSGADSIIESLFHNSFQLETSKNYFSNTIINLWKEITPTKDYIDKVTKEGNSEIDIIIENENIVWFIEAKNTSDISMDTKYSTTRNQIIRNIDVGSCYSNKKNFYFSLLIRDESLSPNGIKIIEQYRHEDINNYLMHRSKKIDNMKGISVIKWNDIMNVFLGQKINSLQVINLEKWLKERMGEHLTTAST